MSTANNFTDFHLRDFVSETGRDPSRPSYDSAVQLTSSLNVPTNQEAVSDDFEVVRIPTLVRIFAGGSLDRLKPGVFIYATGTFNVEKTPDGLPLVVVSAFSVDW